MAVLEVRNLEVCFGEVPILRDVSFDLEAGETLGVVGESGCGKSMTGLALMGMLPTGCKVTKGSISLEGRDLVPISNREWLKIRGSEIALVMQDPFTCLNPMMKIGDQIAEALMLHRDMSKSDANKEAIKMLEKVGVPIPESAASKYPHQMSGGQRQRVVIATAFACKPKVLIADEPTTALDVTLQAQILRLLKQLKEEEDVAVMLVSHDIGVIASLASNICVYYAGRVVEDGPTKEVLYNPAHPYSKALMNALPNPNKKRLESIAGHPPDLANRPPGCSFEPRCKFKTKKCAQEPRLVEISQDHHAACWNSEKVLKEPHLDVR